jgi:hypothetical protein
MLDSALFTYLLSIFFVKPYKLSDLRAAYLDSIFVSRCNLLFLIKCNNYLS